MKRFGVVVSSREHGDYSVGGNRSVSDHILPDRYTTHRMSKTEPARHITHFLT